MSILYQEFLIYSKFYMICKSVDGPRSFRKHWLSSHSILWHCCRQLPNACWTKLHTHNKFSWYFLMFASCDRKLYTGQNYVMDAVVILMWKRVAYVLTSAICRPWKRNKVVGSRCSSLRFLKSRYSLLAKLLWKYVCLCFRVSYSLLYLRAWFLFFLCLVWIKLLMWLIIN